MHCQRQGFPVGDFLWGTIATQVAGGVEWRVQGSPAETGRYTLTLDGALDVGEMSVRNGYSEMKGLGPAPIALTEAQDG